MEGRCGEEATCGATRSDKLQGIRLLQHPRLHVQRTLLLRLQPAINAMSMERVIAFTPRNLQGTLHCRTYLALSLLSRIHLRLTVDAQRHQFAATNSACVNIRVPGPHHHGIPLLQLKTSLLLIRILHFHLGKN